MTDPIVERETGKDHDAAFLARLYLEADRVSSLLSDVVRHLKGKVDGLGVDIAQSQAFEKRAAEAFNSIAETQKEHGLFLRKIDANQSLIIRELKLQGQRITELERDRFPPMFPAAE